MAVFGKKKKSSYKSLHGRQFRQITSEEEIRQETLTTLYANPTNTSSIKHPQTVSPKQKNTYNGLFHLYTK